MNVTRIAAPAELAVYAYDSVSLLAAALNQQNISVDSNYKLVKESVLDLLRAEDYLGISGHVSVDKSGLRVSTLAYVTIYRESADGSLKKVVIGMVQNRLSGNRPQFVYSKNESRSSVWSGQ